MIYDNTKQILKMIELRLDLIEESNKFINEEKEVLMNLSKIYKEKISEIEKQLKKLKGIEYSLYYEIVVNGLNPNKAVEKVALKYDVSSSTIWKSYYPAVKKLIQN